MSWGVVELNFIFLQAKCFSSHPIMSERYLQDYNITWPLDRAATEVLASTFGSI